MIVLVTSLFFFVMIRRPPRSTRTDTLVPTRRSSDLRHCISGSADFTKPGHGHSFDMLAALKSAWPLFVGIAMLMLGHGLQNSLLGIRPGQGAFTTEATGLIMAFYYLGPLGGARVTPPVAAHAGSVGRFTALPPPPLP